MCEEPTMEPEPVLVFKPEHVHLVVRWPCNLCRKSKPTETALLILSHHSETLSAEKEAIRLAKEFPGQQFGIYTMIGVMQTEIVVRLLDPPNMEPG